MARVLLALGSNLGERAETLRAALAALDELPRCRLEQASALHETAPIGGASGQPGYLNAAAVLETSLESLALLDRLQEVERRFGRVRLETWGPRTLDLDVLLIDDRIIDTPRLVVPHPRMSFRRFVLAPAVEVAADWLHPQVGWSLRRLLAWLDLAPRYVAIVGGPTAAAREVAGQLQQSGLALWITDPTDSAMSTDAIEAARREALHAALDAQPDVSHVSDFRLADTLDPKLEPRLTVLLEPAGQQLTELVTRPGRGPWLRLEARDRAAILRELSAALAAMQ
jgi:2-amino-4-hydroxy-6-hydroxymethyldihydropteridine diphosphokinase